MKMGWSKKKKRGSMGGDSTMNGKPVWNDLFIAFSCSVPFICGLLSYFGAGASASESSRPCVVAMRTE